MVRYAPENDGNLSVFQRSPAVVREGEEGDDALGAAEVLAVLLDIAQVIAFLDVDNLGLVVVTLNLRHQSVYEQLFVSQELDVLFRCVLSSHQDADGSEYAPFLGERVSQEQAGAWHVLDIPVCRKAFQCLLSRHAAAAGLPGDLRQAREFVTGLPARREDFRTDGIVYLVSQRQVRGVGDGMTEQAADAFVFLHISPLFTACDSV